MKYYEKTINTIITIIFFISISGACIQTYRLQSTRSELEQIRTQLSAARNREQESIVTIKSLKESVERTNSILSESEFTIAGIRKQIREIRESYEEMESLLNSSGDYNINNNSNLQQIN